MSFDWLQHAFLMVSVVEILKLIIDVCVFKFKNIEFLIKINFKNICLIILKMTDLMLFTVFT